MTRGAQRTGRPESRRGDAGVHEGACTTTCPHDSGEAQWLVSESYDSMPRVRITEYVDAYGNLCRRFVIPPGEVAFISNCTALETTALDVTVDLAPAG
jgi:hypothetical protein